jgi:DNA invertase Pin-like site-specific DNA recombinase
MLKDLDNRGVKFKSLGDPIFDTTTPQGKLMMQVLAAFAEFDRNMIRERCSAGIARAKAEGRRLGRKHTLNPHQQLEALRLLSEGETQRGAARLLGVGQATIARLVALHQSKGEAAAAANLIGPTAFTSPQKSAWAGKSAPS